MLNNVLGYKFKIYKYDTPKSKSGVAFFPNFSYNKPLITSRHSNVCKIIRSILLLNRINDEKIKSFDDIYDSHKNEYYCFPEFSSKEGLLNFIKYINKNCLIFIKNE